MIKPLLTRIILVTLTTIIVTTTASPISAHNDSLDSNQSSLPITTASTDHHQTLDQVLPLLLENYSADAIQDLDCDQLSDEDFEQVGDSWMEQMHPGEAHEGMDAMMGGEGSQGLRQAHINMGRNYLGCPDSNSSNTISNSMMGTGVMAGPTFPFQSGLGNVGLFGSTMTGQTGSIWNIFSLVIYLLFATALIVFIRYFWRKGGEIKK